MMTQEETQLKTVLKAAYPPATPSEYLVRRVALSAATATAVLGQRALRVRRWRLALVTTGAAAAVLFLTLLWPSIVAARTLYRMAGMMDDARSAHIIKWNVAPDGSRTKSEETWYQNGQWRIQDPSSVQLWSQGVWWRYEPALGSATFERRPEGPFGKNSSGFSISALLRDAARSGWPGNRNIHDLGRTQENGRQVHEVLLTNEPNFSHERTLVLADAQTDLPFELDSQSQLYGGEWKTVQISELQYNVPLASALFAARFPKNTRIVDTEQEKRNWNRRLAQGVMTKQIGNRTIVIRDLQVNTEGDVFLLYTDGQFPGDIEGGTPELRDDRGTIYRNQWGFQPCSSNTEGNYVGGMVVNGERVDGGWWVPVTPQTPWIPRRFTLTFAAFPKVTHTKPIPMQPGKVYKLGNGTSSNPEMVTFTLDIAKPACAHLPDYAPYMGFPFQAWDLAKGDAEIRATYSKDTLHDLNRALDYDREVIAANDAESEAIGQRMNDAVAWLNLYDVLHDLGRSQEAKDALLHARDEDVGHNNTQRISDAMNAEGIK